MVWVRDQAGGRDQLAGSSRVRNEDTVYITTSLSSWTYKPLKGNVYLKANGKRHNPNHNLGAFKAQMYTAVPTRSAHTFSRRRYERVWQESQYSYRAPKLRRHQTAEILRPSAEGRISRLG